jgi:endonuclease/exonuclease/phosphatase family metal-dependent hydrolase
MSVIRKLLQFRVATLNVHFFSDINGKSNVYHLAEILKSMSLDAIGLQEVRHTDQTVGASPERHYHFKLLSDLLQLPHTAFCNTAHEFGNAILSRFPLTSSINYYTETIANHNKRGMLAAKIDHEFFKDNNATLYVTHLDQISEEVRLKQMEQLEKNVENSNGFQMIMGDFNSLTFDDYSDDYFNIHIRDIRQRNSWEAPFNLLTDRMKKHGYSDCWRGMNKEAINDRVVTCVYKTRIDYIWKRGELKNGWKIYECKIFPTKSATDHNGILMTFTKSDY